MAQAVPTQMSATAQATAQATQRLEAVKAQIERQRVTVDQAQSAISTLNGEGRALDAREATLRRHVTAAEQALAAAQERIHHAQAAALIDGVDAIDAQASAALVAAQEGVQAANATLSEALSPTGALGAARADLAARRAQAERQLSEARAMLQALERHAYEAHLASGQALIEELGVEYDAAMARLQAAYNEVEAARQQLAIVGKRAVTAFGHAGRAGGSWHASGADGASAVKETAQMRNALDRRVPLSLGRAADLVAAFDTLMATLEQGAGRVPAQIGRHALRAVMQLDHSYFAQHWTFALLDNDSPTASKPFEVMRRQASFLLEEVWQKARPTATVAGDGPKAS